jgi:acetyl esterase/lipase
MTTSTTRLHYEPSAHYEVKAFDIEYRRDGDTVFLARIFQPQGNGPFPTLIDVHGGAWANGDRFMNELTDIALAESGLLIAAIDFRTSTTAPHPAAQHDINYATRWLKAHASDYNGSAEAVGGVGWSSGGHQVMLAAMRPQVYAELPLIEAPSLDGSLAYVIMGWPVIDPLSRYRLAESQSNQSLVDNHLRYFGSEDGMIEASPPHILQRGEAVETPPALLVQGALDKALTRMMSEEFVEAYSLAGGVIELGKYPGEPHGFLREGGPQVERAIEHIKSFIARQL